MNAIEFLATPGLEEIFQAADAPEPILLTESEINSMGPAFAVFCPNVFSGLSAADAWDRFNGMGK